MSDRVAGEQLEAAELCERLHLPNPLGRERDRVAYNRETIQIQTGQNVAAGMTPAEARRDAIAAAERYDAREP